MNKIKIDGMELTKEEFVDKVVEVYISIISNMTPYTYERVSGDDFMGIGLKRSDGDLQDVHELVILELTEKLLKDVGEVGEIQDVHQIIVYELTRQLFKKAGEYEEMVQVLSEYNRQNNVFMYPELMDDL